MSDLDNKNKNLLHIAAKEKNLWMFNVLLETYGDSVFTPNRSMEQKESDF